MRHILLVVLLGVIVSVAKSSAMTTVEFQAHADTVIDRFARFDPVWGTYLGIHDYDNRLADYSAPNVARYMAYLDSELKLLAKIDTTGWDIDNSIDYRLLISNIKMQYFQLRTFPYWKKSPSIYSDQCVQGIYYLVLRDFAPLDQKLPSFLGRVTAIPEVCRVAKINLTDAVPIFIETSIESLDEGINLVSSTGQMFSDKFPERKLEIEKATNKAVAALRDFNIYCRKIKVKAKGNYAIGKKNFEFMLRDIHMLDMNSDSLLNLGYTIYDRCNAEIDSIASQIPPSDTMSKYAIPNLTKKDVLGYYQWEINKVSDFIKAKKLITIPDDLGSCIPIETPPFLRATVRGIAYEGPGVLDSVQTGFFYVRPLPDTFSDTQKSDYVDYIARRAFRGSVVHEAFPGHHLQLTLANRKHSKIRKIQQDLVMVEGWALYCEQMMYEQGLYGKDLKQWNGVLGGIRFRAVRIIVDIGLQTGRFTPETALAYMNEKLGENVYYYTAEIRRYCTNPATALSYLTGKTMILRLKDRVAARDGDSFKLQDFHDKLLSEGSIPIPLIAEKYGW
jgi:uncharacterized protein (DUF885 family)